MKNAGHLAFGLKGGMNSYRKDLINLKTVDITDPSLEPEVTFNSPNVGFGTYYYSKSLYLGVSVPKLLKNKWGSLSSINAELAGEQRHFYAIGGGRINLSENFTFKPFGFLKVTQGAPIEMDITTMLVMYNRITLGTMFRTGDSYGGLLGVYLNDQIELGYSFDFSYQMNQTNSNAGSHEIMLRYDFIFKNKKHIRSPRSYYF